MEKIAPVADGASGCADYQLDSVKVCCERIYKQAGSSGVERPEIHPEGRVVQIPPRLPTSLYDSRVAKVLFLSPRAPYPPDKGDKIRSYHFLRHMAGKASVDIVCCADRFEKRRVSQELAKYCRRMHIEDMGPLHLVAAGIRALGLDYPITVAMVSRRGARRVLKRWLLDTQYDMVFAYTSAIGPYCQVRNETLLVVDFVDCDSSKWKTLAQSSACLKRWIYSREARKVREWENWFLKNSSVAIAITQTEKVLLEDKLFHGRVAVIPNGVDFTRWHPVVQERRKARYRQHSVLWIGGLFYKPYSDGICWFLDHVWPLVRSKVTSAEFTAIGSKPPRKLRNRHGDNGVSVVGYKTSLDPDMVKASVAVVPLLFAPGLQNKILDLMAAGVPVVATRIAADGTGAVNEEHLLVRDNPEGFADAVAKLLKDEAFAQKLADRALAWVTETYDWNRAFMALDCLLEECIQKRKTLAPERDSRGTHALSSGGARC